MHSLPTFDIHSPLVLKFFVDNSLPLKENFLRLGKVGRYSVTRFGEFFHFGIMLKNFGHFERVHFLFGKISSLFGANFI